MAPRKKRTSQYLNTELLEATKQLRILPQHHLLPLLNNLGNTLASVDPLSTRVSLSSLSEALVADELLWHSEIDVQVAVAYCLSHITRITEPDYPFDDENMKDVFRSIVSALDNLSDRSSKSYIKRVLTLETVAAVDFCIRMVDFECDDLITEMFQIFFRTIRDYHADVTFLSMKKIMIRILEKSGDVSTKLLTPLLSSMENDNERVSLVARRLGETVFQNCAVKLKPYVREAIKSMNTSLDSYSEIVSSVCGGTIQDQIDHASAQQPVAKDVEGNCVDNTVFSESSAKRDGHSHEKARLVEEQAPSECQHSSGKREVCGMEKDKRNLVGSKDETWLSKDRQLHESVAISSNPSRKKHKIFSEADEADPTSTATLPIMGDLDVHAEDSSLDLDVHAEDSSLDLDVHAEDSSLDLDVHAEDSSLDLDVHAEDSSLDLDVHAEDSSLDLDVHAEDSSLDLDVHAEDSSLDLDVHAEDSSLDLDVHAEDSSLDLDVHAEDSSLNLDVHAEDSSLASSINKGECERNSPKQMHSSVALLGQRDELEEGLQNTEIQMEKFHSTLERMKSFTIAGLNHSMMPDNPPSPVMLAEQLWKDFKTYPLGNIENEMATMKALSALIENLSLFDNGDAKLLFELEGNLSSILEERRNMTLHQESRRQLQLDLEKCGKVFNKLWVSICTNKMEYDDIEMHKQKLVMQERELETRMQEIRAKMKIIGAKRKIIGEKMEEESLKAEEAMSMAEEKEARNLSIEEEKANTDSEIDNLMSRFFSLRSRFH